MASPHIKEEIPEYLNGDLPEDRRREIDRHLADCGACRQQVMKARSKQARIKRQALKKAAGPDQVPNFLLNRLGRQRGVERPQKRNPWLWIFLLVAAGAGYWYWQHHNGRGLMPAYQAGAPPESVSTDTVAAVPRAEPVAGSKMSAAPVASTATGTTEGSAAPAPVASAPPVRKTLPTGPVPGPWSGADSPMKDVRKMVIRNPGAWQSLWSQMGQTTPVPAVNFDDYLIVAVFAGEESTAGFSVAIEPPKEDPSDMTVYYKIVEPLPESSPEPIVTHPWAMRAIPRMSRRVHIAAAS